MKEKNTDLKLKKKSFDARQKLYVYQLNINTQ